MSAEPQLPSAFAAVVLSQRDGPSLSGRHISSRFLSPQSGVLLSAGLQELRQRLLSDPGRRDRDAGADSAEAQTGGG